jgi:HEPN domain-containing protein
MDIDRNLKYWLESAEEDWKVAGHLLEKGDYSHSLFFGHLTLEKTLKAIFVKKNRNIPPYTHRLVYLAEVGELKLTEEQTELLEVVTDFNIEARYPDEEFNFRKKCTREFAEEYLKKIGEIKEWLKQWIKV